jgi:hypothetical protein
MRCGAGVLRFACIFAVLEARCAREMQPSPRTGQASLADYAPPAVSHFSTADFTGSSVSFDLAPARSGKSVLVVVPNPPATTAFQRTGAEEPEAPNDKPVTIELSVDAIDVARERGPERELPRVARPTISPWPAPVRAKWAPLGDLRDFDVMGARVTGRKVPESDPDDPYVFYEETTDRMTYSPSEYRAIGANVRTRFPEVARRFGPPTDVDGNGKILVLFGHTVDRRVLRLPGLRAGG